MKILGIAGSPRLGGNTGQLLAEVLKGARDKGAEVKTIYVCDLDINPCQHCNHCYQTGDCRTTDDMVRVYQELEQADRLVIASPLHFMSVTAQLKAMIDRGQSRWARKYILKVPPLGDKRERKALFVSVGGQKLKNLFEAAKTTVKAWLISHDIEYAGELTFSGVDEAGAIARNPESLKKAFQAGHKLVTES
jgi:multimeric flavodoxin WrbA